MSAGAGALAAAGGRAGQVDFFVSHAGPDTAWAEWIATTVEAAGYSVELDVWDWTAGTSFVAAMERALSRADRLLALASPDYFSRTWTAVEWEAAFVRQSEDAGFLVPVLIRPCGPEEYPRLLAPLIYIDLVGLDEAAARRTLLDRLAGARRPPMGTRTTFPGAYAGSALAGGRHPPVVFPGRLPPVWGPVPARNLLFTGRDRLLDRLHEQLSGGLGRVAVSALQGLGGMGKTQLAVEYAWRYADLYPLVWWVDAETPIALNAGLAALANTLGVGTGDVPERAAAALAELGRREGWLMIYDNVTDPASIAAVMPPSSGRLILTCRDPALRRVGAELVEVGEFTRDETAALIRRHVPDIDETAADRLGEMLGNLPLAVDQAGAFLAATAMALDGYLALLAVHPQVLLDEDTPHHPGLVTTVMAAHDQLAAGYPAAAALLDQLAFLAPEPIPLAAIPVGTASPVPGALLVADPLTTHIMLAAIGRYALARRSGATVQLHRLVQSLLRARLTPASVRASLEAALTLLGTVTPQDAEDPANWPAYGELVPHITAAAAHLAHADDVLEPDRFRLLLDRACWYLYSAGQLTSARVLTESTYVRWKSGLGADHPDTLNAASSLASVLAALGKHEEARVLDEETLGRRRRILGHDHPHSLISANNLALRLSDLGEYQAARVLDEDTFGRLRRIRGADHPETLTSANNLARRLADVGEYQAASALAEDTLFRRRRVLGEDHPSTLHSANDLALWLAELGEQRAAHSLAEDVLVRRRHVLGVDHPDTLRSANNLALRLADLGDHEAARALAEDTLARMRKVLGEDHPNALVVASNLALELAALGMSHAAQVLAEGTLSQMRRVLGKEHPFTLKSERDLAAARIDLTAHE